MVKKLLLAASVLIIGIVLSRFFLGVTVPLAVTVFGFLVIAVIAAYYIEKLGKWSLFTALIPLLLKGTSDKVVNAALFTNIANWLNTNVQKLGFDFSFNNETAYAIILYIVVAIILLIVSKIDRTATGMPVNEKPEFREKQYIDKLERFCTTLERRIEAINIDTSWNDGLYVPVATEVEMTSNQKKKKYSSIIKCLKKNRPGRHATIKKLFRRLSRSKALGRISFINRIDKSLSKGIVYLVLGDPGSGKSVSLRKLCSELLTEAKVTHRVPVYLNLKEWNNDGKQWSVDNLPDQTHLLSFIKRTLGNNGDIFTDQFIDDYFEKMYENGRWYFVFDSFDEMPCLMGEGNKTELIEKISRLLYEFLTAYGQPGGVIASRLYHSPSDALKPAVILKLQPFDEIRIKDLLKKSLGKNYEEVANRFFTEGGNLVHLCRNPFYLSLFINYYNHKAGFPIGQYDLFSSFIEARLGKYSEQLTRDGVSFSDLRLAAKRIALQMQINNHGLDYPCIDLYNLPEKETHWRKMLSALAYTKICRFGGNPETVSFVHRRFQEYFLVESMIEGERPVIPEDYSCIPLSTGIRDALVLYCEVAPLEKAKEIADYCMDTIRNSIGSAGWIFNNGCIDLVNTIRFMSDAFRNRREAIMHFQEDFEDVIESCFEKKDIDFIVRLAAVESTALFNEERLQAVLLRVFELKNRQLNDLIIHNCYTIKALNKKLERSFFDHFLATAVWDYFRSFKSTCFSLSLSKQFKHIRLFYISLFMYRLLFIFCCLATLAFGLFYASSSGLDVVARLFKSSIKDTWIKSHSSLYDYAPLLIFLPFVLEHISLRLSIRFSPIMLDGLLHCLMLSFCTIGLMLLPVLPLIIVLFLICLFVVVLYLSRMSIRTIHVDWRRWLLVFCFALLIQGALAGICWFLYYLFDSWKVFLWILVALGSLPLLWWFITLVRDIVRLKTTILNTVMQRDNFALLFESLTTYLGKKRLLIRCEKEGVKLSGDWPNEMRPKTRYNNLNYLLVKLDIADLDGVDLLNR